MKIYNLKSGVLLAKIVRYTSSNVIIKFNFEFQGEEFLTLSRENFNGLDSYINENYK